MGHALKLIGYSSDEESYQRHGGEKPQKKWREIVPRRCDLHKFGQKYCCYCKAPLNHNNYTREHLLARIRGGVGNNNLRCCCYDCNQEKGEMLLEEYLLFLQDNVFELSLGSDEYCINQRKISKVITLIKSDDYKVALLNRTY